MKHELLNFRNVKYNMNDVHVISNLSFILYQQEILGLITRDSAEKDVLLRILSGYISNLSGDILVEGLKIGYKYTAQAKNNLNTYVIREHFKLMPYLTVAENLFLWGAPQHSMKIILWNNLFKKTQKILDDFEITFFEPTDIVKDLSYYERLIIEFLKLTLLDIKVIVIDDIFKHLPINDTPKFIKFLMLLKRKGFSIIYLSSSYRNFFESFDKIVITREGINIMTLNKDEINRKTVLSLLTDYSEKESYLNQQLSEVSASQSDTLLEFSKYRDNHLEINSSFSLSLKIQTHYNAGILEVEGDCGNHLFSTLCRRYDHFGELWLKDQCVSICKDDEIRKKIGIIPDCRISNTIFPYMSLLENLTLTLPKKISFFKLRSNSYRYYISVHILQSIGFTDILKYLDREYIPYLSYDIQLKVAIARCIISGAEVIIMQNPDRCFDDYNIFDYYRIIKNVQRAGITTLIFSNNPDTLHGVCDRMHNMFNGKIQH